MITNFLLLSMITLLCGMLLFLPWYAVYEAFKDKGEGDLGTLFCFMICVFEVATGLDWLFGAPSKLWSM